MLRNAFEGLATDSMLRRILVAVSYARTASDQLRVNVDGGALSDSGVVALMYGNRDGYPSFYGRGAPGSVDAREFLRLQHRQLMNERMKKWTYT